MADQNPEPDEDKFAQPGKGVIVVSEPEETEEDNDE